MAERNSAEYPHAYAGVEASCQYVVFSLAEEEYGIQILSVQEIIRLPEFTKLPNTPPFIRGVVNLRGMIIPLLDLRTRFHLEPQEDETYSVVLVVQVEEEDGHKTVGLIVDAVRDVLSLTDEHMQELPTFSCTIDSRFIDQLGRIEERLIIILDVDYILSEDEKEQLNGVVA